jgi:hypothetical protein
MKIIALATILAAASMPAHAAYGWDATKAAVSCTGTTISEAFRGNVSRIVLPAWVPGTHLRAGQWLDENCQVRG